MGALVVDEIELVGEFRVKADGENVFFQRKRERLEQITASKRAGPAHGLQNILPKFIQPGVRAVGRSGWLRDRDGAGRSRAIGSRFLARLAGWRRSGDRRSL